MLFHLIKTCTARKECIRYTYPSIPKHLGTGYGYMVPGVYGNYEFTNALYILMAAHKILSEVMSISYENAF